MTKRLSLLNGLAILAVVCNHAAGWGYTAMFWWADRYRPVSTPNFDQLGSFSYYGISVLRQLTVFSVPAFLFASGYFVAYAARGRSALTWKMMKVRLTNLLVPYGIWSVVIFVSDALQGITYAPVEYLERLVSGRADEPYFYVPLLCQFFLLSPLVVPMAKTRGHSLLLISALLQLGVMSLGYLDLLGGGTLDRHLALLYTAPVFLRWAFFFSLGVVGGFRVQQLKQWSARNRWGLLAAVVVLGLLSIIEAEVIYRSTGEDWYGHADMISTCPYALAVILCFLAFDNVSMPFSRTIYQLGRRVYGIYLLHNKVIEFIARVIRQFAPWILAHQLLLLQPVLFVVGVGIPVLFMAALTRSPARRYYRYLFG